MPTIEELLLGKPVEKKMEVAEVVEVLKGNLKEEILSPEDSAALLGGRLLPSDTEVIEDQVKRDTPQGITLTTPPSPPLIEEKIPQSQATILPTNLAEFSVEKIREMVWEGGLTPEKALVHLKALDKVQPVDIKIVREFLGYRDKEMGSLTLSNQGSVFSEPEYVGKLPPKEEIPVIPNPDPNYKPPLVEILPPVVGVISHDSEENFVEDIRLDQVTLPSESPATKVAYQVVGKVPLKNNRVVLVDGSNMAMRCFFPLKDMCRSDGRRTGLLFGMLKSLRALRRECNALPVLVWDAGGSAKKRAVYAAYKGNRAESEIKTLCFGELQNVKEWLRYLGVPQALQQGEEADDVIGTLAYSTFKDAMVFVHSSDDDFLQLVDDSHCIVVKSVKGGLEFYDSEKVKERMGVPPELVPVFRCFRGDDSDNLPGIPRFQSKKIVELVEKHRSISGIYENPEVNFQDLSAGAREKISGFRGQAEVNLKLMTLDRGLTPEIQYTPYSAISLKALFEEMEFNSFLGDLEGWEADFGDRSGGFAKVGV